MKAETFQKLLNDPSLLKQVETSTLIYFMIAVADVKDDPAFLQLGSAAADELDRRIPIPT